MNFCFENNFQTIFLHFNSGLNSLVSNKTQKIFSLRFSFLKSFSHLKSRIIWNVKIEIKSPTVWPTVLSEGELCFCCVLSHSKCENNIDNVRQKAHSVCGIKVFLLLLNTVFHYYFMNWSLVDSQTSIIGAVLEFMRTQSNAKQIALCQ